MENQERKTQRDLRRRRNLVAKDNRHRAATHKTPRDYRRRDKYPLDFRSDSV